MVSGAAELVRRRWPPHNLAATAVREIVHGLLRPSLGPNLFVLPEQAPFSYERLAAALHFLVNTDRYAEEQTTPSTVSRCRHRHDLAAGGYRAREANSAVDGQVAWCVGFRRAIPAAGRVRTRALITTSNSL
jgi:hypothetical protein